MKNRCTKNKIKNLYIIFFGVRLPRSCREGGISYPYAIMFVCGGDNNVSIMLRLVKMDMYNLWTFFYKIF